MDAPRVFCCMPNNGQVHSLASLSYFRYGGRSPRCEGVAMSSLLTQVFNFAWANALDQHRIGHCDYFLLHHSDVEVMTHSYVAKMIYEMDRLKTPVLSAVQCIKDNSGDTSTAVDCELPNGRVNLWGPRRLKLSECHLLGRSFSIKEVKAHAPMLGCKPTTLLVNTGLLMIDLRRPEWLEVREPDGGLFFKFTMFDRIRPDKEGKLHVGCQPEDWVFSRRCAEHNIPVYATTRIACNHHGDNGWSNQPAIPYQEKDNAEV